MPKGAAANLASGGMPPVATASGNDAALANARSASSRSAAGRVRLKGAFSGRGAAKLIWRTHSPRSSLSVRGAIAAPFSGTSRAAKAWARGTGALKRNTSGRSGRQGDCAFSRSQLNSASNLGRTFHAQRRVWRDTKAAWVAAATPGPQTRRTLASGAKWRAQASSKDVPLSRTDRR